MLAILFFAAIIVLLVAAIGAPYGQSWYARWDR